MKMIAAGLTRTDRTTRSSPDEFSIGYEEGTTNARIYEPFKRNYDFPTTGPGYTRSHHQCGTVRRLRSLSSQLRLL
jgi:hypothetical protein